jgi:putative toxin-antitoxin system antitoxin component (TIGR02293 family)
MLFAINTPMGVDDGVVLDDEWHTLMSHARADRVKLAKRMRAGMSTRAIDAMHNARKINLRLLTDTGLMSIGDWNAALEAGHTDGRMSEMLVRYIRIQTMATDLWGLEKAAVWLQRSNKALDNETPLALLDSDQGALAVETLLGQISHGIAS